MIYLRYDWAANLGNYLFQLAYAMSVSPNAKLVWYVTTDSGRESLDRYKILYPTIEYVSKLPAGIRVVDDVVEPTELTRLATDDEDVYFKGFFQHPQFFKEEVVKERIKCPESVARFIEETYGDILSRANLVSIHVRRGDYLKLPHRHPFVGEKYLKEAVGKFPGHEFVVCSDDIAWCKKFFTKKIFEGKTFHFIERGTVISDLFVQTYCPDHICSNSTFSWWGTYLSSCKDGRIVFPSLWFGPAVRASAKGLYVAGCEIIQNHYTLGLWLKAMCCIGKTKVGDVLRTLGLRKRWTGE